MFAATYSLEDIQFKKTVRQHVREFACVLGLVLVCVALFYIFSYSRLAVPAALLSVALLIVAVGYLWPRVLLPVWENWMWMAHWLGIFVTTIILSLSWFIILIPTALVLRLTGKKVIESGFKSDAISYWEDKPDEEKDFTRLKRQY